MGQQPPARTQHPTASLPLQPSLGFRFYLPHLPNTAKLILPSARPSARPPRRAIQKVRFEIQGSEGRNVVGSGVREAERGGISPPQPFASMNQQPPSCCQARGGGQRGGPHPTAPGRAAPALLRASLLFSCYPKLIQVAAKTHLNGKATAETEQEAIRDGLNTSGVYIFHVQSGVRHPEKQRSFRPLSRCLLRGGSSAHAASLQAGSGVNKYIIPHCLCHRLCPKHQLLVSFFSLHYHVYSLPARHLHQLFFSKLLLLLPTALRPEPVPVGNPERVPPAWGFYAGPFLLERHKQFLLAGENECTEHPNQLTTRLKESRERGLNTEL